MTENEIIKAALNRINLVTLVQQRVDLKASGDDHIGLCPFHRESTPSFHVNKDRFHCFGCGQHGDAITWLKNSKGLTFGEALQELGISRRSNPAVEAVCKLPAVDMESRILRCRSILPYKYLIKALVWAKLGKLNEKCWVSVLPHRHGDELQLICELYGIQHSDYLARAEALSIWESLIERYGKVSFSTGPTPSPNPTRSTDTPNTTVSSSA